VSGIEISEHRINLPDARSTGLIFIATTVWNRRRARMVTLSMDVMKNPNTAELEFAS
jgi:hypothetical protein